MISGHPMSTGFRGLTGCQRDPWDLGRHSLKKKKKEKDKKTEVQRKKKKRNRQRVRARKREREKEKWVFRFSLRSTEIGPSVFVRPRRKVHPRIESYVCVPKSWSFVKLHEVGNFPTLNISNLKVI